MVAKIMISHIHVEEEAWIDVAQEFHVEQKHVGHSLHHVGRRGHYLFHFCFVDTFLIGKHLGEHFLFASEQLVERAL